MRGGKPDLDHGAVRLDEHFVEAFDLLRSGGFVARHSEAFCHFMSLRVRDALPHVHGNLDDLFRELLCEVLDAGAALGAADHERAICCSIQQDRKVHLTRKLHLARDI